MVTINEIEIIGRRADPLPTRPGLTLIEILVTLSMTAGLMALLAPALSSTRRTSQQARCLANLAGLGAGAQAYATDDPGSLILPVHPQADENALHDEGFFDFGGADGLSQRYRPGSGREAISRPLNHTMFGSATSASDFSVYRCPSDSGFVPRPASTDEPLYEAAMSSGSLFDAVGTSYIGNAYRGVGSVGNSTSNQYYSIGVFLRPLSRIPAPAETALFSDANAWDEIVRVPDGGVSRITLRGSPGWHAGRRFSIGFVDGHAESVRFDSRMFNQTLPDGSVASQDPLEIRSSRLRFDCRPSEPILDRPLQ